jgi:hypothetical protein
MLNIDGLVKITKIEDMSDKASKACIYFGNKKSKDSDEYENSFFNAVLVGDAFKKVANVEDKTKIYVTKGIVKNVPYEGKDKKQHSYLSLTIFDFTADEQEINDILQSQGFNTEPKKEEKPQRTRRK